MKYKSSNPWYHIIYWVIVIITLSLVFGGSWSNNLAAFFFVVMLLPVVLGTSYFFNYYLVPNFFLKRKYLKFGLYLFYTIVVSLYLETLVLLFSFVYFVNLDINVMGPNAYATILLGVVMYLLVFLGSFLLMARQITENQAVIKELITEKKKFDNPALKLISNRRRVRIPFEEIIFIESLADYIKVHTEETSISSKEKISRVSERLPDFFIRIHRSFVVNKNKITGMASGEIEIASRTFTIGRSYQKKVKEKLG